MKRKRTLAEYEDLMLVQSTVDYQSVYAALRARGIPAFWDAPDENPHYVAQMRIGETLTSNSGYITFSKYSNLCYLRVGAIEYPSLSYGEIETIIEAAGWELVPTEDLGILLYPGSGYTEDVGLALFGGE